MEYDTEAVLGVTGWRANESVDLLCPIKDTSDFPKTTLERVSVYVYAPYSYGSRAFAKACTGNASGAIHCDIPESSLSSDSGANAINLYAGFPFSPSLDPFHDYFAEWAIVYVSLPSANWILSGYFTTDEAP